MKSFKNFKIRTKLYTGFGTVLVLLAVVAYMSYDNVMNTEKGFVDVINGDISMEAHNANIDRYMLQARRSEKDFLMRRDLKYVSRVEEAVAKLKVEAEELLELEQKTGDKVGIEKVKSILDNADIYLTNFNVVVESWEKKGLDHKSGLQGQFRNAAHELAAVLEAANEQILEVNLLTIRKHEKDYLLRGDEKYVKKARDQLAILRLNGITSSLTSDEKDMLKVAAGKYEKGFLALVEENKNITTKIAAMRDAIHILEPLIQEGYDQAKEESLVEVTSTIETAHANAQIPIWISVFAILIGGFIAFYVARIISTPISKITEVAEAISQGDINHNIEVKSKDEIGQLATSFRSLIDYMQSMAQCAESIANSDLRVEVEPRCEDDLLGHAFKKMTTNLDGMVRQLTDNARELVSAATEIASSSEQMAQGAKNQTDQASQVSSAIEEMSATIVESSKNANEAREVSESASNTSNEGQSIVGDTISGMVQIAESTTGSGQIINELAQASDRIGEIIGVIDDIADQTNLLALNAAIEAARAGEQGRGFAVVADEVRKLAERTGKATGEITDMIKGIQSDSGRAVTSMDEAGKLVDDGKALADKAGNSLTEINSMSQRVTDMIIQIATAADEQSAAAEQISKNMEHITTIVRETATGAEQSASAAEELNRQAEGMQQMIGQFKLKEKV